MIVMRMMIMVVTIDHDVDAGCDVFDDEKGDHDASWTLKFGSPLRRTVRRRFIKFNNLFFKHEPLKRFTRGCKEQLEFNNFLTNWAVQLGGLVISTWSGLIPIT